MAKFHSDDFGRARGVVVQAAPARNRKPLKALLLSVLVVVPVAPLLGMLMGLAHRRASTVVAPCAIAIGLVATIAQCFMGFRGFQFYCQVTGAPGAAIAAGYAGDTDAFTSAFAQPPSPEQAALFIGELRTRYGKFHVDRLEDLLGGSGLGPEVLSGPREYELLFENASVPASVTFAFDDQPGLGYLSSRIGTLTIRDGEHGDIEFPPSRRSVSVTD